MVATNTGTHTGRVNRANEKAAHTPGSARSADFERDFGSGMPAAGSNYADLENISKATLTRIDIGMLPGKFRTSRRRARARTP